MPNKSTLDNVLQSVLAVANSEANMAYAPRIFQSHFNAVTSFLIDTLVEKYPEKTDILLPFFMSKKIPVTTGYIQLPDQYRDLLGAPSITVKADGSDCSDNNPVIIDTEQEFNQAKLKSGCKTRPIVIVDKSKWDYLTTSTYDFPTYKNPIGMYIGGNRIKVCPYDLGNVEVMYTKKENLYIYKYSMNPDDTYVFNPIGSEESQWDNNAFQYLFKGCLALYSAYASDPNLSNFTQVLKNEGIL